jgi:two-component system chemotaxis sensor kinase CheA
MPDDDVIREFLIESNENLAALDRELVKLEQNPEDAGLLDSVFRTIHTIKGTSGFFGFDVLGSITHIAENILSQLRSRQRKLTPELTSLILEAVDAIKAILGRIEADNQEGDDVYQDLKTRLEAVARAGEKNPPSSTSPSAPSKPTTADSQTEGAPPSAEPDGMPTHSQHDGLEKTRVSAPATAEETAQKADENAIAKSSPLSDSTIRVDVTLLDKLMNLVGELVLARNQILQTTSTQDSSLNATSQKLNLITSELQESVMKTRMQPIGVVWNKLPRVVRDLAAGCGKKIQLEMDGAETELDKTIIEAIKDPLTHIVRNSCDHGIELPETRTQRGKNPQGRLLLRAYHEGGHVNIEISDDGDGIDPEKLKNKALEKGLIRAEQASRMTEREATQLVFLPGLSTSEHVTNISGRGVGMDVVKTNVERIGGAVDISTKQGAGTTIRIKIPLTLAIIPGLLVTLQNELSNDCALGDHCFVIPQASLVELIRLEGEEGRKQVESIHGTQVYRCRGKLLPLVYLKHVLQLGEPDPQTESINMVVLQAEDKTFGLVVDGISDTQEIVVKPLGKQLRGLTCYAGASIMGDGKVALILDVMGLAQLAGIVSDSRDSAPRESETRDRSGDQRQTLLLFRTGHFERIAVPLGLVDRLEEFAASKLEFASGQPVLHYRDRILPLVSLGKLLNPSTEDAAMQNDPLQVIVFSRQDRQIGLVVDRILDIVEETVTAQKSASRKGLVGSALVGGKVTDLLDIETIVRAAEDQSSDLAHAEPLAVAAGVGR